MIELVCAWCKEPFTTTPWFADWDTRDSLPCCTAAHAEHVEGERSRFQPAPASGQTDIFGGVVT